MLRNKKILYVITRSDTLGGAHIHVKDMARSVAKDGASSLVVVGGERDSLYVQYLEKEGVKVRLSRYLGRRIGIFRDVMAFFELVRILRDVKPDLVSLHSSKAGVVGRLAAKYLRIPVIFTAHGWSFTEGVSFWKKNVYLVIEKIVGRLSDKIIVVSGYDYKLARKYNIIAEERLVKVHNGMPDIYFEREYFDKKPIRLLMVGRLEPQKDHDLLLKALKSLRGLGWHLVLLGDGGKRAQLRKKVKEYGLCEKVEFVGSKDNVVEYLDKSEIFLLISNWEGLPRSIIEAMRAGLPVIATDVGGVNECVRNGETGYLVQRKNLVQLVDCIKVLIEDGALREKLGKKGRRRYEREFVFNRMYENTINVYLELFNKG